jgi:hypothetical protein
MNDKPKAPRFSHYADETQFSDNNSDFEVAQCDEIASLPSCSKWSVHQQAIETVTDTDDELFLIIDHFQNDNDSGVFISKMEEQQVHHAMADDEFDCYRRTPRRKFYRDRNRCEDMLKGHPINYFNSQESFARTSCKFELVHKNLRSEMDNVKEIINQEQSFLTKIHHRGSEEELTNEITNDNNTTDYFVNNISEFCDNNDTVIV